jgi:hypothetical protein
LDGKNPLFAVTSHSLFGFHRSNEAGVRIINVWVRMWVLILGELADSGGPLFRVKLTLFALLIAALPITHKARLEPLWTVRVQRSMPSESTPLYSGIQLVTGMRTNWCGAR